MKNIVSKTLIAVAACLLLSQHAKADVVGETYLSYYEPTDSIYVLTTATVDYDTLAYYCVDFWGQVHKNEGQLDMFWGGSCDQSQSYYEHYFPFDSNANYAAEIFPQVISKHNYPVGDGYEDYYNYVIWAQADPFYEPYYMNFFGPGPETQIDFSSIILGGVFGIFTQAAQSGPPHHLRVNTDFDITLTSSTDPQGCGNVRKYINYTVVDENNRSAGQVRFKEYPQTVVDTCTGGYVDLTSCNSSFTLYGGFTDHINTGCPQTGPTGCGYEFWNTWQWCHPGPYPGEESYTNLARMVYEARRSYVKIDGDTDPTDGSYKYP
jgi:hypothetical protein